MKHKYVLRNSLYLDEELQEYFNEMSKKGWRLDFIGYYYRFSHCLPAAMASMAKRGPV